MSWWPKLLPHQRELLERIAEGREPVTSRESRLARTVYALRSRRLVTTPRSCGIWTAVITDAGRFYLANGRYVDAPARGSVASGSSSPATSTGRSSRTGSPQPSETASSNRQVSEPVPAPDEPGALHSVVEELRREPSRVNVSEPSHARALDLIQRLLAEAVRRGHEVRLPDDDGPGFVVIVGEHEYRLVMREEWETVDYLPSPDALAERPVYIWQRVRRQAVRQASGRLVIEIADDTHRHGSRSKRWADRKRWRLDDKLDEILAEIERRADLDEQARATAENTAADRRHQWTRAMELARLRYFDAYFRDTLNNQVEGWQRAANIRAYVAAAEQAPASSDAEASEAAREWIDLIKAYADQIDPLLHAVGPPRPPRSPGPEDLRPFLQGWSPYGPDSR